MVELQQDLGRLPCQRQLVWEWEGSSSSKTVPLYTVPALLRGPAAPMPGQYTQQTKKVTYQYTCTTSLGLLVRVTIETVVALLQFSQ